ncbi:MAG: zinc-ribbon domain-containing protein [Chloroflexi bacterium]|nr:zinc-ribbon domain-containing protein [Chloroflexota bacterium]
MKCTNCGKEVSDTANVCGYCGHRLKSTSLPVESRPVPPTPKLSADPSENSVSRKPRTPRGWIFLTVVFGIALIVLAALQILPRPHSTPPATRVQGPTAVNPNSAIDQQQSLSPEAPSSALEPPATPPTNDLPLVEPCDITSACGQTYHKGFDELAKDFIATGSRAAPGSNTYSITFARGQTVSLWLAVCATSADILKQNLQHLSYKLTIDGQPINMDKLYQWDEVDSDGTGCRRYLGNISNWTGNRHTVVTTLTIDAPINDGWIDRPAGDYADIYEVTLTP